MSSVRRKFICLNDNLDPKREEDNAVARAILHDMYESLFPQPSSFELPPEFRNRFLHMTELQAWRTNKNTIRTVVYICLTILITFTLVNFFHVEVRFRIMVSTLNLEAHNSAGQWFSNCSLITALDFLESVPLLSYFVPKKEFSINLLVICFITF